MLVALLSLAAPALADAPMAGSAYDVDPPTLPDGRIFAPNDGIKLRAPDQPHAIVNGTTTFDYENVVALVASIPGYGDSVFCSGTLISPDWILTAAHCVEGGEDMENWYGADIYVAFGGGNLYTEGVTDYIAAEFMIAHPQYNANNLQNDIGLVHLTAESVEQPAVVNDEPVTSSWEGTALTYVGFGITGDNANDGGTKRTANIDFWQQDSFFIYGLEPTSNLCSGDSGGAGFEWTADGVELAGVNSFVFEYYTNNKSCEGGGSGATRVDAYISWIEDYTDLITDYDQLEDTEDPPEDTEVPPDDTEDPPEDTEDPGNSGNNGNNGNSGNSGSDDTGLEDTGANWVTVRRVECACNAASPLSGGIAWLGLLAFVPLRRRRR